MKLEHPSSDDLRAMAAAARAQSNGPINGSEAVFDLGWTNLRIRFSGGTYLARAAGISASCTAGPCCAARAWATKAEMRAQQLETLG